MNDITLICTHHSELGKCNSSALYRILEGIRPDVIFEELSLSHHEIAYQLNSPVSLEIKAVKEYLKNYKVLQVPVDTYPLPNGYFEDLDKLIVATERSEISESRALRNIVHEQMVMVGYHGLPFLNSDANDKYILQIDLLRKRVVKIIKDENLFSIFKLEMEIRKEREYQILRNIYRHSVNNSFGKAIMLIGSGHRKSILKLIKEFQHEAKLKLVWKYINS